MNFVSRTALCAALAIGGVMAVASPAISQAPAQARQFKYSKEEQAALFALQEAIKTKDAVAISTALTAARTAAVGSDAKYTVATMELQLARESGDQDRQIAAVDTLIASGGVPAADLPSLYRFQVNAALDKKDWPRAERALTQLTQLTPNDPQVVASLGRLKASQNRHAEAAPVIEKALGLYRSAGQKAPEDLYKLALNSAFQGNSAEQSSRLSKELLTAYPTAQNWRSALLIYRQMNKPDKATELDTLRLMRFTKSITDERDVVLYADTLNRAGLPGEAKALLDEITAARVVTGSAAVGQLQRAAASKVAEDRASLSGLERSALAGGSGVAALNTADAFFGYGDYAKAATLYRAALQKGGVDAGLVNTRLGMALTLAGQKAEAEAAFKSISGPRAELASFLQLWLAQRA